MILVRGPFTGLIPSLPTPFRDDESLDLDSLDRLIRFDIAAGADAVTVLGPLGEANRLTDAERSSVIRAAVAAAGHVPVIVGTSHPGTSASIALARQAFAPGAAAIMVTPPAHSPPSERIIVEYFERIAAGVALPIVLQDEPAVSQVHLALDLILRLAREVPSITAIKAEALPSRTCSSAW